MNNTTGSSTGDPRLEKIAYPNGQTANFFYLPNIGDQRLQQILDLGPSAAVLSQFNYGYNAAGEIAQWQRQQHNATTLANNHLDLGYDDASQLIAATSDSGSTFKIYLSGNANVAETVSVTAYDASLTGTTPVGQETANFSTSSGASPSTIATGLASAIGTVMGTNLGISASASSGVVTINTSPNHATQFSVSISGTGATNTITLSGSSPTSNLHKQLYYAYDCAGNRVGVEGDSAGTLPNLTTDSTQSSYNKVNGLIGISAGGPIRFQGTTADPIKSAVVNADIVKEVHSR